MKQFSTYILNASDCFYYVILSDILLVEFNPMKPDASFLFEKISTYDIALLYINDDDKDI